DARVEIELGQRAAFDLAERRAFRLRRRARAAAAEQVEGVAIAFALADLGREGGGFAREAAGLHLPSRPPAGEQVFLLALADLALAHAGEEVPVAIVLGRVRLTEPVVLVQHVAGFGRARGRGLAAARVVAGPLAGLQRMHVLGPRVL